MGDIKMCSSCGNSIPVEAVFCPNCGQKQEAVIQEQEQAVQTPEESVYQDAEEIKTPEPVSETDNHGAPDVSDQPEQDYQEPPIESEHTAQQQQAYPESTSAAPQQQQTASSEPGQIQQQAYAQAFTQPQQPQPGYQPAQPAQSYQQPSYPQQAQQPEAPKKPKKRFPWVFTILWIGMLAFIGVWVFLWFTYPESQNPINNLSVDTLRLMTPVVAVVLLIYTLNLKILVKKAKVIPTILLILSILFSVFMFLSFELIEGDWAHDLIRPVTEIFFEFQ